MKSEYELFDRLFEGVDVFYNKETGELFIDDHKSDEQLAEFRVTEDF